MSTIVRPVVTPETMIRLRRARRALASCPDGSAKDPDTSCYELATRIDTLIHGIQLGRYRRGEVNREIRSVLTELEIMQYADKKALRTAAVAGAVGVSKEDLVPQGLS